MKLPPLFQILAVGVDSRTPLSPYNNRKETGEGQAQNPGEHLGSEELGRRCAAARVDEKSAGKHLIWASRGQHSMQQRLVGAVRGERNMPLWV